MTWPAGWAEGGRLCPMTPFFQPTAQGYLLRLMVVPGAQRTQVVGLYGDRLKLRLAAPPEKGSANRELIDFLARSLNLPKSAFKLTVGASSRSKVVAVYDLSPDLRDRLGRLVPASQESA
jgi:uncharacterized protein